MKHLIEKSMTGLIFASVPLLAIVACSEPGNLAQQEPQNQQMEQQIQAVRDRLSETTTHPRVQEVHDAGAAQEEDAHTALAELPVVEIAPVDPANPATVELAEQSAPLATGASTPPAPIRVFHYGFDQKELVEPDRETLKQYAAILVQNPNSMLHIRGHADAQGPKSYNQRLSEQRAQKVADLLIAEGVPAAQLRISGMGDRTPVAHASSHKENRRVELSYGDTQLAAAP